MRIDSDRMVNLSLIAITVCGTLFRLIPPLTTVGLPFYDPHGYYHDILVMQKTHSDPLLSPFGYTGEVPLLDYMLYLVMSYSGLDALSTTKWVQPLLLSVVNIPAIYWLTARISKRRDIGLIGALLFAISDVGALRESYAIPEGIATAISLCMVIALFKFVESRSPSWLLVFSVLLLGVFTAHNLTPFMFFLILLGVTPVLSKVGRESSSYLLMLPLSIAGVFTAFTPLGASIDQNAYVRYAQLISLAFSNAQAITSGSGFGSPLAGYQTGGGQNLISFMELHLITVFTLMLALFALLKYLAKPSRDPFQAIVFAWLIITGVTFVMGIFGDSLFGSNNPFFGYRTWIYLMFPASIVAAYAVRSLFTRGKKLMVLGTLCLIFVLSVSAPLTVHFIQSDSENFELLDAHELAVSNWLVSHVTLPYTVYSAGAFTPTINGSLFEAPKKESMALLLGNATVWPQNLTHYYVILSQRTLDYPFASSSYRVNTNKFYSPFFDVVYSSQTVWVFSNVNLSSIQYNFTINSLQGD